MREVATTKYQLPGVGCLVLVSWAGKAACRDREALTLASIAQTLYVGTLCFECKVISMVLIHPKSPPAFADGDWLQKQNQS